MLGHDAQTGNARQGAALSRWGPPWLPPTRCHHHCWCCRLRHCRTTRHYSSLALGKAWLPAYNGRGRGEPPRHQSSHCCSPSSLRVCPILWPTHPSICRHFQATPTAAGHVFCMGSHVLATSFRHIGNRYTFQCTFVIMMYLFAFGIL